ncbi:DUF1932 domain-containing protein [Shouchella sp. 1P09AA]|uniref:DUF1932 domain-containing protein n=1 Tax=unclassified Shouchella TaxID=2893065 RepID=UPI0039A27DD5
MNIGFLGFGEVGYEMSKGFLTYGQAHQIFAYDPQHQKESTILQANEVEVQLLDDPIKVVKEPLDILFAAVPALYSYDAWSAIKDYLNEDTIYVDLSTASASMKQKINDELSLQNSIIDAAMMGPLKGNQHKVPMMISGSDARRFQRWGQDFDMNVKYVSENPGDATNIKFIRSIFTKGLSTLMHEVLEIANRLDLGDLILDSITQTMEKDSFEDIVNRLITSNVLHSKRRVQEMENVMDFLTEYHVEPYMSKATRDKLAAITNEHLKDLFADNPPQSWKEVMQKSNQSN